MLVPFGLFIRNFIVCTSGFVFGVFVVGGYFLSAVTIDMTKGPPVPL